MFISYFLLTNAYSNLRTLMQSCLKVMLGMMASMSFRLSMCQILLIHLFGLLFYLSISMYLVFSHHMLTLICLMCGILG